MIGKEGTKDGSKEKDLDGDRGALLNPADSTELIGASQKVEGEQRG